MRISVRTKPTIEIINHLGNSIYIFGFGKEPTIEFLGFSGFAIFFPRNLFMRILESPMMRRYKK